MSARAKRHQIFISYSTRDQAIADSVRNHLRSNGITCWIATQDLVGGKDWATGIVHAIDESQALLLILSQASNWSEDVKKEVGRASSKGISIIPFFIENIELSPHMEYFLSTTHWLGADSRHVELRMGHLLETVRGHLRTPGAGGAKRGVVPPAPPITPPIMPAPMPDPAPAATPPGAPGFSPDKLAGDLTRYETAFLTALRPLLRFPAEDATVAPGHKPTAAAIAALAVGGLGLLFALQGFFGALFPGASPEAFVYTMMPLVRITAIASTLAAAAGNLGFLVGGHRMYMNTMDGPGITMAAVRWMTLVIGGWFVLTLLFTFTGPAPVRGAIINAMLTTAFLAAVQIGIVWKLTSNVRRPAA